MRGTTMTAPYPGAMPRYVPLTTRSAVLAAVLKGALEAEGLDVRLVRDSLGTVYGLDTGRFATRILVAEDDLESARRLLDEAEGTEA